MFGFLHNFHPQPIIFEIGPLAVRWYGVLMVVGGLLGFAVVMRLAKRAGLDKKIFYDLLLYFVIGAVMGARVYYVFYAWEMYRGDWLDAFKIWQGGLAIHGIMLGGFAATWLFCRIRKQNFWFIADFTVVGLALAQAVGRIGNYFNQEIFGRPTALPWGIPIDAANRPAQFLDAEYFHPVFLYESLGNFAIAVVLLLALRHRIQSGRGKTGNIFLLYLIIYSVLRFALEYLRVDYSPLVFGIRWPQILSGALVVVCGALLARRFLRRKSGNR